MEAEKEIFLSSDEERNLIQKRVVKCFICIEKVFFI